MRPFVSPRRFHRALLVLPLLALVQGLGGGSVEAAAAPSAGVTPQQLATLGSRKIVFGHQSVGFDMMAGVAQIAGEHREAGLRVLQVQRPAPMSAPGFVHWFNGVNGEPLTKIAGFAEAVDKQLQGGADIAFFKFCYVDIDADTDVTALFTQYKASMARLAQQYPKTTFVHLTSPLTVVQSGPKAVIKRLLGRPDRWALANQRREQFNDLMRAEYRSRGLFDLAAVESTLESGARHEFEAGGRHYGALIDGYSTDGKHLNSRGQRWAASQLLAFLAELPRR